MIFVHLNQYRLASFHHNASKTSIVLKCKALLAFHCHHSRWKMSRMAIILKNQQIKFYISFPSFRCINICYSVLRTHTEHFRVSGYLFYEALLERIKRFAFKSLISSSHCQQTFQNIWDFRAQVMRLWSCISCAERCIILVEKLHQFSVGLLGILNAMCKLWF